MIAEAGFSLQNPSGGRTMEPFTIWSLGEMLTFQAAPFVVASDLLGQLRIAVLDEKAERFDSDLLEHIKLIVDSLVVQLRLLDLRMTLLSATRLSMQLSRPNLRPADCREEVHNIIGRLRDELDSAHLLSLSSSDAELYEVRRPPFGWEVEAKFPSIVYELHEASKCQGLERSTAAAFHYIRSLEAGIRAVCRSLGIPDPTKGSDRSWSKVLKSIDTAMNAKWPANQRISGDAQLFQGIISQLTAMQNPYRNETMHLDAKYTPEEVRHIAELVGAIMKKIASRMDENGQPLA